MFVKNFIVYSNSRIFNFYGIGTIVYVIAMGFDKKSAILNENIVNVIFVFTVMSLSFSLTENHSNKILE